MPDAYDSKSRKRHQAVNLPRSETAILESDLNGYRKREFFEAPVKARPMLPASGRHRNHSPAPGTKPIGKRPPVRPSHSAASRRSSAARSGLLPVNAARRRTREKSAAGPVRCEKADTNLRIALDMQGTAEGLSLDNILQNYCAVEQCTAERLRDAIECVFPHVRQTNPGELPKRWRLPSATASGLARRLLAMTCPPHNCRVGSAVRQHIDAG